MKQFLFVLAISLVAFISYKEIQAQTAPTKVVPAAQYYEGGQTAMYEFINSHVLYPAVAKRNRIQGECIIGGVLEADGTMTNVTVVKNIGGGCGEEAARVVKLLKFRAPGFKSQTSIPVYFKL
ncbi:energy transducer TonB [Cytophaga hutchinsonii]|jgi:protein TonB|uniref:TonB-related protein n=1 Tax=Cytophaga hutchinsonii (strain ATCC 33406 / DSM 1761 / CIP 103989 / NBRC 15051 / NCIMB 9469 / D465) TaxID=269798 RepID=A0A6N4SUA6_CYTH3|nr:energy transducer TonB [Cytophaga hutchinsonii]ABG59967.1 tonB-related protein [Cytophaga hutchinsonii ATCC 33406]SFX26554.1 protein TonB [Cytophaga hutchinsonii ATCC 33406]